MKNNTSQPYRVIVWCAVSSKQQATEDKASLPAQEVEGREFAEVVGGVVVDVLTVPGHSRDIVLFEDAARQMDAYQKLRDHCEASDFDVLWARDPDRLGRDPALAQTVASLVERSGAEVYCASAPHVLGQGGSGQRYVYAIQSVRAGEDQQRRREYQRMGMRRRIKCGLLPSSIPIGYRPIRDMLSGATIGAEFDANIGVVRLATDLFLKGCSYYEIRRALNDSPYHPPRSERWAVSTVRKILSNPVYAGRLTWGEYRFDGPSERFPALWDEKTYRAILRERQNRKMAKYRRRGGSPFLDVAFCARCGARMVQRTGYAGALGLRCGTHARGRYTGVLCHANNISLETVREATIEFLDMIVDLETLSELMGDRSADGRDRERLAEIERQLEAAEVKRRRLAMAFASGDMDLGIYRETDDQIVSDAERLQAEAAQIESRLVSIADPEERLAALQSARPLLVEKFNDLQPGEIATALRNAGLRIKIENREIVAWEIR